MTWGLRRANWLVLLVSLAVAAVAAAAQTQPVAPQEEHDWIARARVFPEVGPGVRAIHRDAAARYYILAAPNTAVLIFGADGKRLGQIPPPNTHLGAIVFAEDFDIDPTGRIVVADRAANAVKVFESDGSLALTIPLPSPTAVAALPAGEIAAASVRSKFLVTEFDASGKWLRDFGDWADTADRADLNRFVNLGRLATDSANHIYYAFAYLPEPTLRKYDRFGFGTWEEVLGTLDFLPAAQAQRREIGKQEDRTSAPHLRTIISAIGVDPVTQDVWVALGDLLVTFDKDGNRRAEYRTFTAEGARVEAVTILVEPNRLLLGADPMGIYEFARPGCAALSPAMH